MHKTDFANQAPRCCHLKANGDTCRAAARRGARYCVFHENAHFPRPDYEIPFVEDAASLLHAVSQVIRALHDKALDTKTAAVTLYALQIASGALKRYSAEQQATDYAHEAAHQHSLAQLLLDRLDLEPEEEGNAAEDARFRAEDDAWFAKLNPPTAPSAGPPLSRRSAATEQQGGTDLIPEIKACAGPIPSISSASSASSALGVVPKRRATTIAHNSTRAYPVRL